jgi:branched-chain amino acid transport system substrate-binding protein
MIRHIKRCRLDKPERQFAAAAASHRRQLVLALFLLWFSSIVPANAVDVERVVLIGFAAPLTSSRVLSAYGSAQMAVDEANRRGIKIDGKKIVFKLLAQDDKGDPRTAALVAGYFIKSGVVGVVGHWNSGSSIATAQLYAKAGIPQLPPATISRKFTQQGATTAFQVLGNDDTGAAYLADFVLRSFPAARIAIIEDNTPFGKDFADRFTSVLKENGGNIVYHDAISKNTSDFNSPLLAVKKLKADVVFFGCIVLQSAELAKNMKRLNVKARLISMGGTATELFLKIAGDDVGDGVLSIEPGLPQEELPGWKTYHKNYFARNSEEITHFAPFAYDATNLLIYAIQKANSLDPKDITATLRNIRYSGLTGQISFDDKGNLVNPSYTIYRLQNKMWVPADVFTKK